MLHSELTEKIIAAAYEVYNKMGYGYLESVNFAKDKVEVKRKVKIYNDPVILSNKLV